MNLHKIYSPITATPFACGETYMEFAPCEELKPYIKCFWGTEKPLKQRKTDILTKGIVTPDTCMDIIFNVDFTNNRVAGKFCGIDDRSFQTLDKNDEEKVISTFAIRFFPWSAVLFAEDSMQNTKNGFFEVDVYFSRLRKEIEPLLFDVVNIKERIVRTERYLLSHIYPERSNPIVMDAMAKLLQRKGNMEIGQLAREVHTSNRQLERLFQSQIGISPKQLSSLIRYQCLWRDVLFRENFQVLDAVYEYGYTDQAHLLHDFKRFHTMNISQAKEYAKKHVAFLQEICK